MIATLQPHMIISTNTYTHICNPEHKIHKFDTTISENKVSEEKVVQNHQYKKKECVEKVKVKVHSHTSIYMPPREIKDSLFWCFSQIVDGDLDKINDALKKIQYVDELTPIYPSLRKRFSLVAFSSITNFLAYEQKINVSTMLALCAYKQINVCILYPNSHFICESAPGLEDYYVIRLNANKVFSYTKIKRADLATYTKKSIPLGLDKTTLKSVSAYTSKQLKDYAELIDVSLINSKTGKPKIKQVLYESLINAIKL